jgi:acetyltransferase-like isoleucine patch superfamily enzyme
MTPDPPQVIPAAPARRPSRVKAAAKAAARGVALAAVLPVLACYRVNARLVGRDQAIETATQFLSLVPGTTGQYLRRAFLRRTLAACHPTALVEFGTIFSQAGGVLGENVYVGPGCVLGLVRLERDVLLAAGVQIPSGGRTHYFDDPTRPIREQGGERRVVTVGEGAWVGTGAIVLADVGKGTVVAAGAVVTRPLPDHVIAGGVPARVIRPRFGPPPPPAPPAADHG